MARTKLNANQVVEDTLEDKDGDTKIEVEEQADGDEIVFTTAGQPRMLIANNGQVGIGVETPSAALDVGGNVQITNGVLFHEDYLMAELSIPGLDIQADTNAWTFNCPYNMTFEEMDAYLDTVSGDLDITVTNLDDANNTIFSIENMTTSPTSDTTATNANVDTGDRIRFAISNVTGSPQGLRVNVRFRRRA